MSLIKKMINKINIKSFTPKRVEFTDGTIITAKDNEEFDYDIIKKILEAGEQKEIIVENSL